MDLVRRQAREIALQILFQQEFTPQIDIEAFLGLLEQSVDKSSLKYAESLIEGIKSNSKEIDQKIQSTTKNWTLERMSSVDKNILRIATFEMIFSNEKIQPQIAINEAIEIAKKFGSTDSGSFVNGILDRLSQN